MKRVIKFWNRYNSDEGKFSDSSTDYEVLPFLVPDNAGPKELQAIAKKLGISIRRPVKSPKANEGWSRYHTKITHFMKTGEKTEPKFFAKEKFDWYIGFITLPTRGFLVPSEKPNKKMTEDDARHIIDSRLYGVADVGNFSMEADEDTMLVVMEGWNYYHEMALLGYDRAHFEKLVGADPEDGRVFEDEADYCSDCGTWDYRDDGYTYNHRYVESQGNLGLRCGCFDEYCKRNIKDFVDDIKTPMTLEVAEDLESDGKLKHMERFIGGMTDGRGGYFKGKSTREGTPEGVLKEYKEKYPKANFVFTHDESGQFQSYFSIWKVTAKGMKQNKKRAA